MIAQLARSTRRAVARATARTNGSTRFHKAPPHQVVFFARHAGQVVICDTLIGKVDDSHQFPSASQQHIP